MYQYQELLDYEVLNHTRLGRDFQQLCRQDNMLAQLEEVGFMDGGCLSLALAVQAELGEQSCQIRFCCTPATAHHAVAYIAPQALGRKAGPGFCLDADGLATPAEMLLKMQQVESVPACTLLRELTLAQAREHGIVDLNGSSQRLRPLLRAFFLDNPPLGRHWLTALPPAEILRQRALVTYTAVR